MTDAPDLPRWVVPQAGPVPRWEEIPGRPLVSALDGGPAEQPTTVRAAWDAQALYVRFECSDRHAWGTLTRRDDPLYQEEAVEVFLAPGTADPTVYLEFEVSPLGVLWDGRIHNPTSRRADLVSDAGWDCPGVRWQAGRQAGPAVFGAGGAEDWWAELVLPWEGIAGGASPPPRLWRANFYRIERPADGPPEFTAWSPTLAVPADFHKPARFGVLELGR
jgi:Carbohydrate family 9 binding domain-like